MASIAVAPLILKDMILTIGTDSYEKHVSRVQFIPNSQTKTWRGGTPTDVFTDVSSPTWTCQIDYVQDWTTASSLSQYLLANAGSAIAVTFKPQNGVGPSFTATLNIIPGAIGGQITEFATTSVTLGSDTPVLVPAV